ncbi:hypothetical protein DL95DRAFT_472964 [Leptodontidium sp. 2 PMI_412]|nr:hypothetical protein DL95DRAFT_472964 [Leptodontidium sp. 2 PMI_412]
MSTLSRCRLSCCSFLVVDLIITIFHSSLLNMSLVYRQQSLASEIKNFPSKFVLHSSLSNPMQTKKEGMKIGVKSPNFLVPWKAEENRDADFEISRGFLSPPSSYGSRFPTVPFRSLASSTLSIETAFSLPHFHIHFSTFKHISSNIIRALPNSENSTNDLGASVINVDSTATTYAVSCDATAELVHDSTPISCIWETVGRQIFTQ